MKRTIQIEKFLTGEKANLYSIRFNDSKRVADTLNETQKFFNKIKDTYPEDYQIFKAILKNILTISGAKEKFFRNEDNSECNFLKALIKYDIKGKKYNGKLRLFCLYYNSDRVILGNGGYKSTRTFNEDNILDKSAKVLQKLDKVLEEKERDGEIKWEANELKSNENLFFDIIT